MSSTKTSPSSSTFETLGKLAVAGGILAAGALAVRNREKIGSAFKSGTIALAGLSEKARQGRVAKAPK